MENMERKFRIAQQFLAGRSFELEAGRQLLANPDVAKDQGLKITLLDTSLTTYRAMMYALGTPIESIDKSVRSIRGARSTRNGVFEFAQTVYGAWDGLSEKYKPVELQANEELHVMQPLLVDPST